jgi:hypothetical protein
MEWSLVASGRPRATGVIPLAFEKRHAHLVQPASRRAVSRRSAGAEVRDAREFA